MTPLLMNSQNTGCTFEATVRPTVGRLPARSASSADLIYVETGRHLPCAASRRAAC